MRKGLEDTAMLFSGVENRLFVENADVATGQTAGAHEHKAVILRPINTPPRHRGVNRFLYTWHAGRQSASVAQLDAKDILIPKFDDAPAIGT